MEENSSVSVGDTDRLVGETVAEVNQTNNDLLLRQPFTNKSGDQTITGEVISSEQEGDTAPGGAATEEMVVDNFPTPLSEDVSSGDQIAETEEMSKLPAQLVPSSGFNGSDVPQLNLSKDWVLSQIELKIDKVTESHSQEMAAVKEEVVKIRLDFERQLKEKDEQLQNKQKELEERQKQYDEKCTQYKDLEKKHAEEIRAKEEAEEENSCLVETLTLCDAQMKQDRKKIGDLKREIKYLTELLENAKKRLEDAKKASRTDDTLKEIVDLLKQQQITPTHQGNSSPTDGETNRFRFTEELHIHKEVEILQFSPNPSICDQPSEPESD